MSLTEWMVYRCKEYVYMIREVLHRIGSETLSLKAEEPLNANGFRSEPQGEATGSLHVRK